MSERCLSKFVLESANQRKYIALLFDIQIHIIFTSDDPHSLAVIKTQRKLQETFPMRCAIVDGGGKALVAHRIQ